MLSRQQLIRDFPFKLQDLVDIKELELIFDKLYEATGIPSAIIDLEGNVLTGAGWQRICTDFHRKKSETLKKCIESDILIRDSLSNGQPYVVYRCPHGLFDASSPVIIQGKHVANVFAGQILTEPLNDKIIKEFRKQAYQYGFDEDQYLKALAEVPILPIEKFETILNFLSKFAEVIATQGLTNLISHKQNKFIEESETKYRALIETTDTAFVIVDEQGHVMDANQEYVRMTGHQQLNEILGCNVVEWTAEYDRERNANEVKKCFEKGFVRNLEIDYVCRDGSKIPVEINGTHIEQEGKSFILTLMRDVTERKKAVEKLHRRQLELKETNIALKILLRESKTMQEDLEKKIMSNVKELVIPYVEEMEGILLNDSEKSYLHLIKSKLEDITASFTIKLTSQHGNLTPKEVQVADLVRMGKMNKEIARLLNVSISTVDFHRRNIRKKLGIKGKKANLQSHLMSSVG